jgi:uncharacterized membrane protein
MAGRAPGVICLESGSAVVWIVWTIPIIVTAFVLLVVLVRRTLSSVDDAVDRDPIDWPCFADCRQ